MATNFGKNRMGNPAGGGPAAHYADGDKPQICRRPRSAGCQRRPGAVFRERSSSQNGRDHGLGNARCDCPCTEGSAGGETITNALGSTSTTMSGKVIAITDASSGIGAASALLLAGRDAKVVLGARRTEHLESLATRIITSGGEAAFLPLDVRRREDLAALVEIASTPFRLTQSSRMQCRHRTDLAARRVARCGLGRNDRCEPEGLSVRNRRCAAGFP
jgi:short chain dehydrogenase